MGVFAFSKKVIFELRMGQAGNDLGKSIPGRWNRKCKVPRVGTKVECWRHKGGKCGGMVVSDGGVLQEVRSGRSAGARLCSSLHCKSADFILRIREMEDGL